MKLLLESGWPTVSSTARQPCLHEAAAYGRTEIAQLILDAGASIEATNGRRETAVVRAVASDKVETAELLLERGASLTSGGRSVLTAAVDSKAWDFFKATLRAGLLSVDAPDGNGQTPLTYAVSLECPERVRAVLRSGASADGGDPPPLLVAAQNADWKCVVALLAEGAERRTPTCRAGRWGGTRLSTSSAVTPSSALPTPTPWRHCSPRARTPRA